MAKFVCTVCGWSTEADKAPERCPLCGATTFKENYGKVQKFMLANTTLAMVL